MRTSPIRPQFTEAAPTVLALLPDLEELQRGILARNSGEAGVINLQCPPMRLTKVISTATKISP